MGGVVFVSHSGENSGAPIVLTRLFRQALKEEKEEVFLVFRYSGELSEASREEFGEGKVFTLRKKNPREIKTVFKPFSKLYDAFCLINLIRKIRPKIIIANSLINTTAIAVGLGMGCKVIVWAHELPGTIHDPFRLRRFWIKKAQTGVGVSVQVCDHLRALGMESSKIHLIHHGLDLNSLPFGKETEKISFPDQCLKLGALAVWSPNKRLDLILETAVVLARSGKFSRVRLDIGGPVDSFYPDLIRETRERISEEPSNLILRFLGSVEDLNHFYQDLDAVLVASNREALPTVALEALNYQVPVFSFDDLAGVKEILGELSLLARERSGPALAEKIMGFVDDPGQPELLDKWRKAALERSRLFAIGKQWQAFQEIIGRGN
jgi:glycosyltransferase involved in cell wall biosynthesis